MTHSSSKRTLALASLLVALSAACSSAPPRRLVILAGRLVDGTGAPVRERQRIVIEEGSIIAVEPDAGETLAQPDTVVIDARGETVLPGLINAHTHLFSPGGCEAGAGAGLGAAVRNLHALRDAGVTVAADLGAPAVAAVGLRRWVGTARHRGPRVMVAGPLLVAPGGYYMTGILEGKLVKNGTVREVASPEEARAIVRELADADVDLIKVGLPPLEGVTLCALVDEAHTQELRVLAHAVANRTYAAALACKVDGLAHGVFEPLEPATLARLKTAGVTVAPTLSDAQGGAFLPASMMAGVPRGRTAKAAADGLTSTRAMHEAGVPLAMGTDGGFCMNPLGSPLPELERLVAAGLTPLEALAAATTGSARLIGLDEALGRIAPGYRGDILTVAGRPDERIGDIAAVRHVILDGVEQERGAAHWYDTPLAGMSVLWAWLGG